jgi:LysM repeat protein
MLCRWLPLIGIIALCSACRLSLAPRAANETNLIPTVTPSAVSALPTATPTLHPTVTASTQTNTGGANNASFANSGNSAASNPNNPPACTPRREWHIYLIVAGDTLSNIAQRANTTTAALTTANCLSDPNKIEVGQALYVPQAIAANAPVNPPSNAPIGDTGMGSGLPPLPDGYQCYYMGWGIGEPHAVYFSATTPSTDAIFGTVPALRYYRVQAEYGERYQIQYDAAQNRWGWVNKGTGALHGNCGHLATAAVNITGFRFEGVTFDYPLAWFAEHNIKTQGLGGGFVGNVRPADFPPTAFNWTTEMVHVSYTVYAAAQLGDLQAWAQQEANSVRNTCSRCGITQEVTPFTNPNNYSGFVFEYNGPYTGAKVYFLRVDQQVIVINVSGNRTLGEVVVNNVRGG